MEITQLEYNKKPGVLKHIGSLFNDNNKEIIGHYLSGCDSYLKKINTETDKYYYYLIFRFGYVLFYYFFSKKYTLRDMFLKCKDYTILRVDKETGEELICGVLKDGKEEMADIYGPLPETFYDEYIYSEYAKQLASQTVK